jgi:hypothetical protein
MAKPTKRRVEGGRVTPKGGAATSPTSSPRYTPPNPAGNLGPSPMWVPILMFTLLGLGILVILMNYIGLLLPGATSNAYLVLGLVLILSGIVTATQFR